MSHADEARKLLGRDTDFDSLDAVELSASLTSITHAVLELAEQQRIANLVALAELGDRVLGGYAGDAGPFATIFDKPTTQHGNVTVKPEIAAALKIGE